MQIAHPRKPAELERQPRRVSTARGVAPRLSPWQSSNLGSVLSEPVNHSHYLANVRPDNPQTFPKLRANGGYRKCTTQIAKFFIEKNPDWRSAHTLWFGEMHMIAARIEPLFQI